MSLVVGLTGGIGSGKSAAADIFASLGAALVDTDVIAHGLTASGGAAMAAIRDAFGPSVVNAEGALDRAAMRARVFTDAGERARLEAILHPLIRAEAEGLCRVAQAQGAPYVVLVVPLLIESGDYRQRVDRVAVVDCPEETQLARVMARSGMTRQDVERILAAQASRAARRAAADDLIDNGGDLDHLRQQVEILDGSYRRMAIARDRG